MPPTNDVVKLCVYVQGCLEGCVFVYGFACVQVCVCVFAFYVYVLKCVAVVKCIWSAAQTDCLE